MNRRPSQSRTGFDSFSPQHTAHFKAAQPGGEFFEPKPRASLGRRLLLALLLMTLIALAVNLAVNQFVQVARNHVDRRVRLQLAQHLDQRIERLRVPP